MEEGNSVVIADYRTIHSQIHALLQGVRADHAPEDVVIGSFDFMTETEAHDDTYQRHGYTLMRAPFQTILTELSGEWGTRSVSSHQIRHLKLSSSLPSPWSMITLLRGNKWMGLFSIWPSAKKIGKSQLFW